MEREAELFLGFGGIGSLDESFNFDKVISFIFESEDFIKTDSVKVFCYKDIFSVETEKIEIDDYEYKTPVWVRAYFKGTKKDIFVFPRFSSTNFVVEIVNEFAELMLICILISFYIKKRLTSRNFAVF